MRVPPSALFTAVPLGAAANVDRTALDHALRPPPPLDTAFGEQALRGMPFDLGGAGTANAVLLTDQPVQVRVEPLRATYVLFVHLVEDRPSRYQQGFADTQLDGNELGDHVADYTLSYADGSRASHTIRRRFAIQQARAGWGASAFAAVPATRDVIARTVDEESQLGRRPQGAYGRLETRHQSARDAGGQQCAWVYAMPNPRPDQDITGITLAPRGERSVVYGIAVTEVEQHPLRPGTRRKLLLTLPAGLELNAIGELEPEDIGIDLGQVISARAAYQFDHERWLGAEPNVQPERSRERVVVEYEAHPQAKLYVGREQPQVHELAALPELAARGAGSAAAVAPVVAVAAATRPVRLTITERGSSVPVPVRLHIHGAAGEYLPPKANHRKVNGAWFEDNYGEFVNGETQYSYVSGACEIDLPLGQIYVELTRGYEVTPLRRRLQVTAQTGALHLELDRALRWRERGWVTADTHVHFLSPTTALLEGGAEGVNVVNLLASQWGEMFSNVSDFDGKTTLGARDFGGDGEFLVRVGTENRMQVLGHISLLGYSGDMIVPLCSGGASESAIGDRQELTMAQWAQRCIDQNGLVVMPHGPNPQCERAADIVLGLVHAIEMMTFNPCDFQLNPYGIADWYRYLNLGYRLPIVGGSDKMAAAAQLGGVRTYTQMGELPFTYENWMAAMKAGNTFVTVGPLVELAVAGTAPGGVVALPAGGGTLDLEWRVESVSVPIEQVEVVVGGLVEQQVDGGNALEVSGSHSLQVEAATWVAVRVRGSYNGKAGDLAAHTSAVQVEVDGSTPFNRVDAGLVLEQIEGAIAYVDTIAPRPDAERFRQLRATLAAAWNRMHQQMHRRGVFHDHTVLHDHAEHHEH